MKSTPSSRRTLTRREESAVALVALRMVAEEQGWKHGDRGRVVRMLDVMFRGLDYQIAPKAFGTWLIRLGIEKFRKDRYAMLVVPDDLDSLERSLGSISGKGNVWVNAVKAPILERACRLAEGEVSAGVGVDGDTPDECPPANGRTLHQTSGGAGSEPAHQHQDPAEGGDATEPGASTAVPVTRGHRPVPVNDWLDEED